MGNEHPRRNGPASVNRLFVGSDVDGPPLVDAGLRAIRPRGALCAQAVDYDRDGWQDLLLCGGTGRATRGDDAREKRLHLYRNRPGPDGRRLVDVSARLGIAFRGVVSARLARLNGDRWPDLVVVSRNRPLTAGAWVTTGDVDGRRGADIFVVQDCHRGSNVRDLLLVHRRGWTYDEVRVPRARGCGDTAAMLDVDGDGRDDIIVGNGRWGATGPFQVLTAGPWRG